MDLDEDKLWLRTLGGTSGKYCGGKEISAELNDGDAANMSGQLSIGLNSMSAVLIGGGHVSPRAKQRYDMPQTVPKLPQNESSHRPWTPREMRFNAIINGQAVSRREQENIPKRLADQSLPDLRIIGLNPSGQSNFSPRDATIPMENVSCQSMMRPGVRTLASAQRIFNGVNRSTDLDVARPKTAPLELFSQLKQFTGDSLAIRGVFTPCAKKPPVEGCESGVEVSPPPEVGLRGGYLTAAPECYVMRGLRPAQGCMSTQLHYGYLRPGSRVSLAKGPANTASWGKIHVFQNSSQSKNVW